MDEFFGYPVDLGFGPATALELGLDPPSIYPRPGKARLYARLRLSALATVRNNKLEFD